MKLQPLKFFFFPFYTTPISTHGLFSSNKSTFSLFVCNIITYIVSTLVTTVSPSIPLLEIATHWNSSMKWYLCIRWNPSIPTPWNEDTSVYSGTHLFQLPEMRTPLYIVEPLYSNTLKWGHLCIKEAHWWRDSIVVYVACSPSPWLEDVNL